MEFMKFDADKCSLCGICVEKCPFGALTIEGAGIVVSESCRMCGLCVRNCPEKAIQFEQKAKAFNKDDWKNFLIYVEQERGEIHPVTYELVGEARKMAGKSRLRSQLCDRRWQRNEGKCRKAASLRCGSCVCI